MKRFAILAAVVVLIGCTQNDEGLDNITNIPSKSLTEFYASMPECDTRTYVEDNKYLRWNAGDEITVFAGNSYNGHWQFAGEDGANSGKFNEINEGGFVTGSPLDLTANYAIYPYDENITITEAGVVSLTLPAVQEYNHTYANSFGEGTNTMMAVTKNTSDNFLSFKNLCGYLKLKFYGDDVIVKSVTVKGNNGEKIAGKATVSMAYGGEPTITMSDDATDTITIDCGEGVTLSNDAANPTTFWVVIPEITFEGGITIEVTDINDQTFEKKTTNAVPIENNLIQPMAALGVEVAPAGPANNEIWYTATEMITPAEYTSIGAAFGSSIVSHSFDDTTGCGIIQFETDLKSIGESAFCYSLLSSITLPSSIEGIGPAAFYGCANLGTIYLPQSLTYISRNAFYNCQRLQHIYIEDVASWCNVSMYGRDSCPSLYGAYFYLNNEKITSLVIPSNVTTIEAYTFMRAQIDEIIISDGVTKLGLNAFKSCTAKKIYIPQSVTDLGCNTFELSYGELEINCECISNYIATGTPFYRNYFSKITIGEQVTTLEDYIFNNNSCVEAIKIGSNVTSIGDYAFYHTPKLAIIEGPYVSMDKRSIIVDNKLVAFAPANINEYSVPEGVVKLRDYVMSYDNLTSVTLPSSVETIGNGVFSACKSLQELYCKALNPPTIGSNILPNLSSGNTYKIYVPFESLSAYRVAAGWSDYKDYICGYDFENNVVVKEKPDNNEIWYTTSDEQPLVVNTDAFNTPITSHAYSNGKGVITFGATVTSVDEHAFYDKTTLTSITLPDCVTSIGSRAFAGSGLISFTFPTSLTTIGDCALSGCPIETLICNTDNPFSLIADGDSYYYTYEGLGVSATTLSRIEGKYASADNRFFVVGGHLHAFAGKGLASPSLTINNLSIQSYVFNGCELKALTLTNCSVCTGAMSNITLGSLTLNSSSVRERAVSGRIDNLTINNGCNVSYEAFDIYCKSMYIDTKWVDGDWSDDYWPPFYHSQITEITFGPNVEIIGEDAFANSFVKTVYCESTTPPTLEDYALGSYIEHIYVPYSSVDTYKAASEWKRYSSLIEGYNF